MRGFVTKNANCKDAQALPADEKQALAQLVEQVRIELNDAPLATVSRLSAELNAIIKLYDGQITARQDIHHLLCTDTWLGEQTAELVAHWLRRQGITTEIRRQSSLQTESLENFQLALADLVCWCQETLPGYRQSGYRIVFNLTGGFKSVQGFLQTLAMFYADEAIYVFESGKELLRIPRLPLKLDMEGVVREHLAVFRRLGLKFDETVNAVLPETLLITVAGRSTLSAWGELVWEQVKPSVYAERVYPAPSAQVQFSDRFMESVKNLSAEHYEQINRCMDQLTLCLEKKQNVQGLDFKQLKQSQHGSTHELDAWADKRIYGHFANGILVLDRLGDHL